MRIFNSWDGTQLAYRMIGSGPPLVCVPGGPGQAVEYLGDLGGLSEHRTLVLLDNRGTGASQAPKDPATYRVDQLVRDVEALREHLGLDRIDLLGHSASGGIAMLYLAEHPHRLEHVVIVAPSLRVVGMASDLDVEDVLARRAHEPWHAEAVAALRGDATTPEELERYRRLSAPLMYRHWNAAAKAQADAEPAQFSTRATDGFYAGFTPDPTVPERLGTATVPVLLVAGEYDIWPTAAAVRELARLFHDVRLRVLPDVGHFPWVDDPTAFVSVVDRFLSQRQT